MIKVYLHSWGKTDLKQKDLHGLFSNAFDRYRDFRFPFNITMDQATKQHMENEILPFLSTGARGDVKAIALRYFLEMTGSKEGRDFIGQSDKFLPAIISLTVDKNQTITRDAFLALINLSTEDSVAWKIMNSSGDNAGNFILDILDLTLQEDFDYADETSSIIANVTRVPSCARSLCQLIVDKDSKVTVEKIVSVLCKINFNKKAKLHYLGPILANLTQSSAVRQMIMDKERCIIQRLLPFTEFTDSTVRRGGIIAALKNCCFEYDYHEWLLSEEIDILPRLLLPLAGPEEFDEDDMERLPVDLQYLPPEKKREEDPDLRTFLIEALTKLCSSKKGRMLIKQKNAYVILRELHKWERDPKAKLACQKLCELLIGDEPTEGMEDLHKVEVPSHLAEAFNKMDVDLLKDFEEEEKEGTSETEKDMERK